MSTQIPTTNTTHHYQVPFQPQIQQTININKQTHTKPTIQDIYMIDNYIRLDNKKVNKNKGFITKTIDRETDKQNNKMNERKEKGDTSCC